MKPAVRAVEVQRTGRAPRASKADQLSIARENAVAGVLESLGRRWEQQTDGRQRDVTRLPMAREDALQGLMEAIDRAREQNDANAMIASWRAVSRLLDFDAPQVRRVELRAENDWRTPFEAMSDGALARTLFAVIGSAFLI